ncbi:MAG: hydratase [Deltaproteobacteria bacterium]
MTERGKNDVDRTADEFVIGPSTVAWRGGAMELEIREVTFPIVSSLVGRVRLEPEIVQTRRFELDEAGRHIWSPVAPRARVEVELTKPSVAWRGSAYLDTNWGSEPLESAFVDWSWSRCGIGGDAVLHYDVQPRRGPARGIATRFDASGASEDIVAPDFRPLPTSAWGVKRNVRSQGDAELVRTLENAPFYNRNVVRTELFGTEVVGVHESLSLDRFAHPIVKLMLPFRMPRRAR